MSSSYTRRNECASCGLSELKQIIDYGNMPLAGCFPKKEELDGVETYPLALLYCSACKLVQTNGIMDPNVLFKDYRYLSSVALSKHFRDVTLHLQKRFALTPQHRIVEIGSNDGVFLVPMMEIGCDILGFEPSTNVSKVAKERGCTVINDFFSLETARRNIAKGSIDLFFAANCFAHIHQINSVVQAMRHILKQGGHAVIEVHYVKSVVEELQYDFVYHEHAYYYSVTSLSNLFAASGMTLIEYEEIPVHSGSLRIYVRNQEEAIAPRVQKRIDEEKDGVANWNCYKSYALDVQHHKEELMQLLQGLKENGHRIVGYGASGRASVLCNFCGIGTDLVDYIVDESPERYDRHIPVQNISIKKKEYFDDDEGITYVLIFAWNFSKMVMDKLKDRKLKFVIPFPKPNIVESIDAVKDMYSL